MLTFLPSYVERCQMIIKQGYTTFFLPLFLQSLYIALDIINFPLHSLLPERHAVCPAEDKHCSCRCVEIRPAADPIRA
jgi:hypothetical protein